MPMIMAFGSEEMASKFGGVLPEACCRDQMQVVNFLEPNSFESDNGLQMPAEWQPANFG